MQQGTHDSPARWTSSRLTHLIPGTTVRWWQTTGIAELLRRGVLHKVGKGYIGKQSEIEAALLGRG